MGNSERGVAMETLSLRHHSVTVNPTSDIPDMFSSPPNKATLFAKEIVATLERWSLVRGRSK